MGVEMGFLGFIVLFVLLMGSCKWLLTYERQEKIAKERKIISSDITLKE
jgi:hypothetical protein